MLPLVSPVNYNSGPQALNKAVRNETGFFKAATNYIPPVAEISAPKKNENKTTNQTLVASSTTFLAQLISQNDNVSIGGGPYQQLLDFSLVKYMPSYASYPSNSNEQLELFPEEAAPSYEDLSSAVASATYAHTEASDQPHPANKVISLI